MIFNEEISKPHLLKMYRNSSFYTVCIYFQHKLPADFKKIKRNKIDTGNIYIKNKYVEITNATGDWADQG